MLWKCAAVFDSELETYEGLWEEVRMTAVSWLHARKKKSEADIVGYMFDIGERDVTMIGEGFILEIRGARSSLLG